MTVYKKLLEDIVLRNKGINIEVINMTSDNK